MTKLYFTIICLIFTITIFAQDKENNSLVPNYSESIPYQPTVLSEKKEKKKKEIKNLPPTVSILTQFEIPVYVFDKNGVPTIDLKKEDFTLFVDDKEQPIEKLEVENRPMNIILMLDFSASTGSEEKKIYENIAFQISERLVPQNNIKIIEFADKIKVLCEFTKNLEDCKKPNKKVILEGGTAIYETIETITKEIIQKSQQTIIMVLTDGMDTVSKKSSYRNSLIFAEKSNATVFPLYLDLPQNLLTNSANKSNNNSQRTLGLIINGANIGGYVGPTKEEIELGKQYLRDIATLSGGRMFGLKKPNELGKQDFDLLSAAIKPHYSLSFNFSDMLSSDRRIQLKLRVNRPNLLIRTRGSRILPTAK